jgi:peptidoglycan hydrolase-like protein with peptidoglycan-binding domain
MALISSLFRGDPKLEACLVNDAAHLLPGSAGPHVGKVQRALIQLDGAALSVDDHYGPATANAVLKYKEKRRIINRSYQSKPDNIVGKMTIAAMDGELAAKENRPESCRLDDALPNDVPGGARSFSDGIVRASLVGAKDDDDLKMQIALGESRRTLLLAIASLEGLRRAIIRQTLPRGAPLTADETRILTAVGKWLNVNAGAPVRALPTIGSAISLMRRNVTLQTSKGTPPPLVRVPGTFHAQVTTPNSPDVGVQCGDPFFTVDGPNCRRDVVTHEIFHFLDVHHGGGALNGPTIRSAITTPAQALDSADNLAQLVAEIVTPGGKTDACARVGE